jgi:hypothetical protein
MINDFIAHAFNSFLLDQQPKILLVAKAHSGIFTLAPIKKGYIHSILESGTLTISKKFLLGDSNPFGAQK